MTLLTKLQTSEPAAFGGFSEVHIIDGKAVKILEDACYVNVLEECYMQNIAAEAGLAPKVYAVAELIDEVIVVMDIIDDSEWFHPDAMDDVAPTLLGELNEEQQAIGLKLYCQMLNAKIVHSDFHSGNWFINEAGEAIAIDFGIASLLQNAPKKHLKRAVQFILPCLPTGQAETLIEAWNTDLDETRKALSVIASINA